MRLTPAVKNKNSQDAVGKDSPDMMSATSSFYEIDGRDDQPDDA
jgi:hypothetical protein